MLSYTTISNHFQFFIKCSHGKYEKLQHSSSVTFAAINATLTNIQISSVSILKVELLNYILIFVTHTYFYSYTFNEIIANTYIIFLNFIFTLSQCLSCSHPKPYNKLHRFVVQFRLQLLRISHFSDCFHEVFLNYKIMISTNCKHTCFSTNISQVCSIKAI